MDFKVNRTDVLLMQTLESNDATNPAFGLTITEIMTALAEIGSTKSRMSVYRRLRHLVDIGYIAKGVLENHADTFYLVERGKRFIEGEI